MSADTVDAGIELRPGALLRSGTAGSFEVPEDLWGFGGMHGGLSLGLLTAAMAATSAQDELLNVTGRYHRPIRSAFGVTTDVTRSGRSTEAMAAAATSPERGLHVEASALFGARPPADWPPVAGPPIPDVPRPDLLDETYLPPPELVPIGRHYEIRPVGPHRPVTGGSMPELMAWIRLLEDDEPPDRERVIFLLDTLPPSWSAMMTDPFPVPTVEYGVRPSGATVTDGSPWLLVKAVTRSVGTGGWLDEQLDAWSEDGTYIAAAQQFRVLRGA